MPEFNINHYMKFAHGLSCETRIKVLQVLRGGEKNVSEILEMIGGSQSNLSQHLACLKDCGFVSSHPHGKYIYYTLARPEIHTFLEELEKTIIAMHWDEDVVIDCISDID